jgi:ribosomal protein S20
MEFMATIDSTKKKLILDTFHKEQNRKRQSKQGNAVARAAECLENNDIQGMYALIQELQSPETEQDNGKNLLGLEDSE